MDQSRYNWIQKEQTCFNSNVLSSFGDSWEEQAFAEDSTGPLGGCIWPPRSYTCSFCRREFRSAQALGGHMNVHRRDRARLKKNIISTTSNNKQLLEPHHDTSNFDISCVLQNPNNPNFHLDHPLYSSSSTKPSTLSILTPFTCSFSQQHTPPMLTCSKFEPQKRFHIADLGNQEKDGTIKVVESNFASSKKKIELHLASELNPLIRKRCDSETPFFSKKDDGMILKKRRILEGGVRSFLPRNSNLQLDDDDEVEPPASCERSTSSTLDLELRLGDRP